MARADAVCCLRPGAGAGGVAGVAGVAQEGEVVKPPNRQAAYIQFAWLREEKRQPHSPSDRERNMRRFWKRQASKVARREGKRAVRG